MEPAVTGTKKRRGRKRKRNDELNVAEDCDNKRKAVVTRSLKLVGRYVRKDFQDSGQFLGKIISYDSGLYRINYEDGDFEDLDSGEVKLFLVEDGDFIGKWSERREKLDLLLFDKEVSAKVSKVEDALQPENMNQIDSSMLAEWNTGKTRASEELEICDDGNGNVDADSSSDSREDTRYSSPDVEDVIVPPPELPPSSGHIGIPEEYVSHLLSVHSFLRSFSIPLFLYPFGLDDFVGALNCSAANTLLESVHVALLNVLKRHIERPSSDGSDIALKRPWCLDWSLLDSLTWPIFLVHYLMVMGYTNMLDWKEFYTHSLERDYYSLPAGKKLIVLQMLCDDVLDSEELRAEMAMREESEVGIDVDTTMMPPPTGESRRFHPRYSKTCVSLNAEATNNIALHQDIKPSIGSHSTQIDGPVEISFNDDGNGDECRICGMDGLLICCDGCPSSYHSRCLGLNKMHMPDGSWYCPECKINGAEPTIVQGTSLRGGKVFGVDPYGHVFVATCEHLLILKASVNSECCIRYYSRHDIPRVLRSLYSKREPVMAYSEICKKVMQYWELPESILPHGEISDVGVRITNKEDMHLDKLLETPVMEPMEVENAGSCATSASAANVGSSSNTNHVYEPALCRNSLDTPANPRDRNQQRISSASGIASLTERYANVDHNFLVNGPSRESKFSFPRQELNSSVDQKPQYTYGDCLYMGSFFKTTGYINNYLHGDFAASAAANLAILTSEESQVPESRSLYNRRKAMSDNVLLQIKAFSSVALRFFWPNTEKRLFDPRERCSWCFSCKAPVVSKRGCLLNAAASNAARGAIKVPAGVRTMKNGDGRLAGIASYIMHMEEGLSSLVVGPFLNDTFRKRWRKQLEQASTCNELKILLLELEENIRTIALSGDWIKLVDSCSTQSSTSQLTGNAAGTTQKRRPGRPSRKHSAMEVAKDDSQDTLNDFTWWRGGILSKIFFQRGILPCSIIRKAARQGGLKKINGIQYVEGLEVPKICRQLIWRSAVEMSHTMAQVALQVRYLDFCVRWSDLVRPEQTTLDGKSPDTEASAFRNAFICDKKILEREIRYCVDFGNQKHLPSRVLKNIAEVEQILNDGKERYWFSEKRVPLYLIRDYEEKLEKHKPVDVLSKLQKRQCKGSLKNIFSYLWMKQDNTMNSHCCSCHEDVMHRNAFKCTTCQGFCHEQCATSSTVTANEEVKFFITCKRCCESRAVIHVQRSYGSPRSPLLLQGRDLPNAHTTNKRGKSVAPKRPSAPAGTVDCSDTKPTNSSAAVKKSNNKHWGLRWKKNHCEETGIDFRLKNILFRGNPDMHLTKPFCRLCKKSYNPDLMYIRCENCKHWFHADAVELDESKIFSLVGFKCSKCRRIKSPKCPYSDPAKKKALDDKLECGTPKQIACKMDYNAHSFPKRLKEGDLAYSGIPTKPEAVHVAADGPPLLSLSEVEHFTDTSAVDNGWNDLNASNAGPRKLPVRRHIKHEHDTSYPHAPDPFQMSISVPGEANDLNSMEKLPVKIQMKNENHSYDQPAMDSSQVDEALDPSEKYNMSYGLDSLSPQAQWIVSEDNFDDGITLDYDDDCLGYDTTEFEPQTYFSFHELLASDDGGCAEGNESSESVMGNWGSSTSRPGFDSGTLEMSCDVEEPIISVGTGIEMTSCKICSQTEPSPDLTCQTCGIWLHSYCSPWLESSSGEDMWRCGDCREWE